ncbi:MAG: hypothetical protein V7606_2993 [Burkholderiales bacterium]|jgi:hypothetical protein
MKSLIVTTIITLLAGCASTDSGHYSSRDSASGDSGTSAGKPRLDKQDDMFHSWIN